MHIPLAFAPSPACCDQKNVVSSEMICKLLPGILEDFRVLCERHKMMRAKKRLQLLARPTTMTPKHSYTCPCREAAPSIEIVRMEEPVHTRTEQLAYPQVRSVDLVRASRLIILIIVFFVGFIMVAYSKLLKLKRQPSYTLFEPARKKAVNVMINKSLHSLYSRLSNTQPPKPPKKARKWDEDEWNVHKHYMNLLSKPKKVFQPVEAMVKSRTISSMKRTNRLATAKNHVDEKTIEWHLTQSQRNYVPSQRLTQMAKPKMYPDNDHDAFRVKPSALFYNASERIKTLAAQSRRHIKLPDERENPFQTSRKAIKAKTPPRMIDLSRPKSVSDIHNRGNPFAVQRGALHYRITSRIKELAKPRIYAN